jgi:hypothetical protein
MTTESPGRLVSHWWKKSFYLLLVISIIIMAVEFYNIIDEAVTIGYMEDGYKDTDNSLNVLLKTSPYLYKQISRDDVLSLLKKQNPANYITEHDNAIFLGQLVFVFDSQGKLVGAKSRQEFLTKK